MVPRFVCGPLLQVKVGRVAAASVLAEVADILALGPLRLVLVFPDKDMGKELPAIIADAQVAICLIESFGTLRGLPALKEPKRAQPPGNIAAQPAVSPVGELLGV